eukprot:UN12334
MESVFFNFSLVVKEFIMLVSCFVGKYSLFTSFIHCTISLTDNSPVSRSFLNERKQHIVKWSQNGSVSLILGSSDVSSGNSPDARR